MEVSPTALACYRRATALPSPEAVMHSEANIALCPRGAFCSTLELASWVQNVAL